MEYKPEVKVEGEQDQERRHAVTFKRPYLFERREYAEVDLSGLDELTVKDAIEVQKQLFGQQEVAASLLTETTTAFAQDADSLQHVLSADDVLRIEFVDLQHDLAVHLDQVVRQLQRDSGLHALRPLQLTGLELLDAALLHNAQALGGHEI